MNLLAHLIDPLFLGLINGFALLLSLYVGGITGRLVPAILLGIPGLCSKRTRPSEGEMGDV